MFANPFKTTMTEYHTNLIDGWAVIDDYGNAVYVPYSKLFHALNG